MLQRGCCAAAAALVVVLGGAEARAQYSRRTPIVEAVQKTRPSVVTIKVLKQGQWGAKEIVGTGVIIDERGYAVTNRHVVSRAQSLTVHLADGSSVDARVHTEDPRHDLAIIRLQSGRKYQALAFAPASDLMVGETVIAVGHPFGYSNTVSTGIVSALGREITMPEGEVLSGLIQTNASINPGNSGGPLLNINGELIGINVALREGAQGIAFALNADTVQAVLSKQLSAANVSHVEHGLACREVVREGKERQQVVVDRVAQESAAAKAGLRRGDVVLKLGTRAVGNRFDLERALWGYKAGDKVEAAILREGKETHVALTLTGGDAEVASARE
jgi:serine protease Do